MPEFADLSNDDPDAVVVGDAGEAFTYEALNEAFGFLLDGATLLAMGDNRYFRGESGMCLDQGPFVRLLEHAAGVEAEVLGKPSRDFFQAVLDDMSVSADRAVMIGDDLHGDVGGAQAAGLAGVLVRTGKFRPDDARDADVKPDHIADDFGAGRRRETRPHRRRFCRRGGVAAQRKRDRHVSRSRCDGVLARSVGDCLFQITKSFHDTHLRRFMRIA